MGRLIDGDALIAWIKGSQQMTSKMKSIICYIKTMPTVDAVSVVRCKDCKYAEVYDGYYTQVCCENGVIGGHGELWNPDDFCSYGEKETDHE